MTVVFNAALGYGLLRAQCTKAHCKACFCGVACEGSVGCYGRIQNSRQSSMCAFVRLI